MYKFCATTFYATKERVLRVDSSEHKTERHTRQPATLWRQGVASQLPPSKRQGKVESSRPGGLLAQCLSWWHRGTYSTRPLTRNVKYGSSLNFLFSAKDEDTLVHFLNQISCFFGPSRRACFFIQVADGVGGLGRQNVRSCGSFRTCEEQQKSALRGGQEDKIHTLTQKNTHWLG